MLVLSMGFVDLVLAQVPEVPQAVLDELLEGVVEPSPDQSVVHGKGEEPPERAVGAPGVDPAARLHLRGAELEVPTGRGA